MNSIKIDQAPKCAILFLMFLLFSGPIWAQGVELNEEQQIQLAQNMEQAKQRLELTEEQAIAVEEIMRNSMIERFIILDKYGINPNEPNFQRPDMNSLRQMRDEMDRLDNDVKKQLKNHLSKDQMKAWKKLERERKSRMRGQMMGRG